MSLGDLDPDRPREPMADENGVPWLAERQREVNRRRAARARRKEGCLWLGRGQCRVAQQRSITPMAGGIPEAIRRWHVIALERRADDLAGILAEDCVFESPVVHTPQKGRAIVEAYLRGALHVLNTEHFRYGEEWYAERSAVLEFFSEVDGVTINGVDIISWNHASLITHFKVMVRPLKAINTLHAKMGEYLMKVGTVKMKS